MKSQKVVLILLVSFLTVSLFARGKNDIETHEVENFKPPPVATAAALWGGSSLFYSGKPFGCGAALGTNP